MLRPVQALTRTELAGEGEGQSAALIIAQPPTDPGGWLCELHAESSAGFFLVKRLWLTAPLRVLSRVIATCTFPGARRWRASVQSPAVTAWSGAPVLPIKGMLSVSDQPFALGELEQGQPGARGYGLAAALGSANVVVPPGALMREVSALGEAGGTGTITLEIWRDAVTWDTLPAVPLPPDGRIFTLPRRDLDGASVRRVLFGNTVSYFAAWVE